MEIDKSLAAEFKSIIEELINDSMKVLADNRAILIPIKDKLSKETKKYSATEMDARFMQELDAHFTGLMQEAKNDGTRFEMWRNLVHIKTACQVMQELTRLKASVQESEVTPFAASMFWLGYLSGWMTSFDPAATPFVFYEKYFSSIAGAKARKRGHDEENLSLRQPFFDQFAEYVRSRIAQGYKGSAEALVIHALKQPEFEELKAATSPRRDNMQQITKRAFIKRDRLVQLASALLKNTPKK